MSVSSVGKGRNPAHVDPQRLLDVKIWQDARVPGAVAGSPGSDALRHVYGFSTADTSGIATTSTDSSGTTGT